MNKGPLLQLTDFSLSLSLLTDDLHTRATLQPRRLRTEHQERENGQLRVRVRWARRKGEHVQV